MRIKFSVSTRKDGSIGIPKKYRREMGYAVKIPVDCVFDSDTHKLEITPSVVACTCCGRMISPKSADCDPVMGTCGHCTEKVLSNIRAGMNLRSAMVSVKNHMSPMGIRGRK